MNTLSRLSKEETYKAMALDLPSGKVSSVLALVEDCLAYTVEVNPKAEQAANRLMTEFCHWLLLGAGMPALQWVEENAGARTGKEWLQVATQQGFKIS